MLGADSVCSRARRNFMHLPSGAVSAPPQRRRGSPVPPGLFAAGGNKEGGEAVQPERKPQPAVQENGAEEEDGDLVECSSPEVVELAEEGGGDDSSSVEVDLRSDGSEITASSAAAAADAAAAAAGEQHHAEVLGVTVSFLKKWARSQPLDVLQESVNDLMTRNILPQPSPAELKPATCLIIHAWEESFADLLEALAGDSHLENEVLFLFCLQNPLTEDVDEAAAIISQFKRAYVVITLFTHAKALERPWCTFEILLLSRSPGARTFLCLTPSQRALLQGRITRSRGMDHIIPPLVDNCELSWLSEAPNQPLAQAVFARDLDERKLREVVIVQMCLGLISLNDDHAPYAAAEVLRRMSVSLVQKDCVDEAYLVCTTVIGPSELAVIGPEALAQGTSDSKSVSEIATTAHHYTTLADACLASGRPATEALRVACEAHSLLIACKSPKANVSVTSSLYIRLAQALKDDKNDEDAELMVQRALDNAQAAGDNSLIVNALNVWREVSLNLRKIQQALDLQRKAFEVTCMMRGPKSREANMQLQALAYLLLDTGDLPGAEQCFGAVLGHGSLAVQHRLAILNTLAQAYLNLRDRAKAEIFLQRAAMELKATVIFELNESTYQRMAEFLSSRSLPPEVQADLLWEAGRRLVALRCFSEAMDRFEHSYSLLSSLLGPEHPKCMSDLIDYVALLHQNAEYDHLIDYVSALQINTESPPEYFYKVLEYKGMAYDSLGILEDADNEFGKVWAWHDQRGDKEAAAAAAKRSAEMLLRYALSPKSNSEEREERMGTSILWFKQALKAKPDDYATRVRLCEALLIVGKLDKIEEELKLDDLNDFEGLEQAEARLYMNALKIGVLVRTRQERIEEAVSLCKRASALLGPAQAAPLERVTFIVDVFVPTLLLWKEADLIDCLDATQKALACLQEHYGHVLMHPDAVRALWALGNIWWRLNELGSAEEALQRAFTLSKAIFKDPYHPLTVRTVKSLEGVWAEQGTIDAVEGVGDNAEVEAEDSADGAKDNEEEEESSSSIGHTSDDETDSSMGGSVQSLGWNEYRM